MTTPVLAKAWVGLIPTLNGAEKQIQSELAGVDTAPAGKTVGKKFGAALAVGAVAAGALIAKGLSDAITNASDLSESVNAVNVSYGAAADGVLALSKNSATALGLSSADFNSLAVQFSAFSSTIAGEGGDVVGTLEGITTRASDFASVMNLEVADAAALFQSGLAGETEPLRRYGIDLSAAAVEAYALANGIGDGTGKLTEAEKVQARYGALMEQTSKTQGDFANTSDGYANSQRILGANLENLSATIGQALIPALAGVTAFLIPVVTFLAENQGVLIAIAAAIGVTLVAAFIAWTASIWASTIALLANPVTWIVLAIIALIAALVLLVMNWDAVVKFITDIWSGFVSWLMSGLEALGAWWTNFWGGISRAAVDLWQNGIVAPIKSAVLGIWNFIQDALTNISRFWRSIWEGAASFIGTAFSGALAAVRGPINGIIGLINTAIRGLNSLSVTIPDWVPIVGGQTWGLSIPTIPQLAAGATIMPTPGGTLAILAEAGRPESVVDTGLMNRALEEGLSGRSGGSPVQLIVNPGPDMDEVTIGTVAAQYLVTTLRSA